MKKKYIILAVLAAAVATSCVKEQFASPSISPLGENDIAFVLNKAGTKADQAQSEIAGVTFPVGADNQGNKYYLEETITTLNASPATKGIPAYTENVGTLYPTMGIHAVGGVFGTGKTEGDTTFAADEALNKTGESPFWRYRRSYASNPWPVDKDEKVDFYLYMPVKEVADAGETGEAGETSETSEGVSDLVFANQQISFSYKSPKTGAAQQDIIFGQTSISKNDYDGFAPNGAPVTMYHALTGVKFSNGHDNNNPTKTIITKVEISGLKSTGSSTFTDGVFEWERLDNSTSFTQEFTNQAWSQDAGVDGTVDFTSGENNTFGESWYAAGNTKNLNDDNGSLTFWFIPQEIDENVTLKVTFRVKTEDTQDGTEITHTIKFGEEINKGREQNIEWKAGELRTYTLKPYDVDVKIVDTMNSLTKSNLHVTNTGNVDEYVRIMVIGNWYGWETEEDMLAGKEPDIMVGYTTDGSTGDNTMVRPWFREDSEYGQYFDDSFKGGRPAEGRTDWVRGTGSYFYYTEVIGAGVTLDSATQALFQSYTLPEDKIPTIYIPTTHSNVRVPAWGVHLKMEIVVQAIGTTAPDGSEYRTCWAAWSAATGKEIKEKAYTDD